MASLCALMKFSTELSKQTSDVGAATTALSKEKKVNIHRAPRNDAILTLHPNQHRRRVLYVNSLYAEEAVEV